MVQMYRDFLNLRAEIEGGGIVNGMTYAVDNGGGTDNIPNIIPPAMAASVQVEAIAAATIESNLNDQGVINSTITLSASLLPTVQPEDIAAVAVTTSSTIQVNLQIVPEGFGSYLDGILPKDLATAAGAFSATMQQIKNIRNIPIEKFAQVAATLETIRGLNLVNGTDVPTDTSEAEAALALMALGSGSYGTYTFSDFFGCMSGLPYPWVQIQPAIKALQSNTLSTIYQNLYLAVTWKQATLTVVPSYSTTAVDDGLGNYTYYYKITAITGISSFDRGGGYGRGGAAAPTGTFTDGSGATITTTIDTNSANVTSTYGKVLTALLNSTGTNVYNGTGTSPTPPAGPATLTVTIQEPPTTYGGSGWPAMNTAVQHYIDAANAEIAIIRSTHPGQSLELNDMWDNLGTQLNIEQRTRNTGLSLIPNPRTDSLFPYPIMVYSFTDLVPAYSKLTEPNMAAQTLEAISDLDKNAGQSIVAMMRAERNKARLLEAGISTDDVIDDVLSIAEQIELISNGTVANSAPAFPFNTEPAGYFDPATTNFLVTTAPVQTSPNQAINPNNPANPFNTTDPTNPITNPSQNTIEVQPSILGAPASSVAAVLGIGTPDGLPVPSPDIGIGTAGISQVTMPAGTVPSTASGAIAPNTAGGVASGGGFFNGPGAGGGLGAQGGGPIVPGSLAGSPYTKLIPPSLNPIYTSGVLLPASLPVQAAIEEVIKCNCDCWIQ